VIDDRHDIAAFLDFGSRRIVNSYATLKPLSARESDERSKGGANRRMKKRDEGRKGGKKTLTFSFERFEFGNPMTVGSQHSKSVKLEVDVRECKLTECTLPRDHSFQIAKKG